MEEQQKTLTASQRLEGLEQGLSLLDQQIANLTMNLQTSINALTLLSKKVEAMVRIGNSGQGISSALLAAELIKINVEELEEKVKDLKDRGLAVEAEAIQDNSFIVGRELDSETKEVENARIQFPMFGLNKDAKDKLLGKKVGDIISLGENRNLLEITEIYNIVVPTAQSAENSSESESSSESKENASSEA